MDSDTRSEKKLDVSVIISSFIEFINTVHNSDLVDTRYSPNENKIVHIYNDGTITEQKGSFAYMQRTEFILEYGLSRPINPKYFPINDGSYGYAVVTLKDAKELRSMIEYFIKQKIE